jgi:nitrate reductase assembly molybdenum cofactor insertion protein NarJ
MTEELSRVKAALKKQAFELSAAAEAFDRHRQKLESDLEQSRDDLAVALRLQALREADLEDLQQRYAELRDIRERQHELLVQLGQRLKSASETLQRLEGKEGSMGDRLLTEPLARVLSGELESTG